MQFSLGHVLELLDRTILNPWITGTVTIATAAYGFNKNEAFLAQITPQISRVDLVRVHGIALRFAIAGLVLRVNRFLNQRALNNGTDARFDWAKEIIVVTGGAGGIGAKTVLKLASKGSTVIVLDVLPLTFSKPSNVHYYKCDLTNYDDVLETASAIAQKIGNPTCIVANAGICRGKTILEADKRDIELTFGVNNLGLLWTAKAFLPSIVARNHGHLLVVASQTGHLSAAGVADYSATKAAAIALYEGLQTEIKHKSNAPAVRVSCVSPSAVQTKMFDGIKAPSGFVMPRLEPDDVADHICSILWSGKAQNTMLPASAYISRATRLLPDWLRVAMQDGAAGVMSELNPHKPLD